MSTAWSENRLGDALTPSEDWIEVQPDETYREVTVKLWGKGVIERGQVEGAALAGARRKRVRARQFILSRIDARNGALGIVPANLDGAIVSNDFPVFDVDESLLLPEFLGWMSKTASFVELCKHASEGTTNRVRLKEDRFLNLRLKYPDPPEQKRILARIEELAGRIDEAKRIVDECSVAANALLSSIRASAFGDSVQENWVHLRNYVDRIESGKSPATQGRAAEPQEWGVLKVGAVSFGFFDDRQNKALPEWYSPLPDLEVAVGDFIMSRANTQELVGACAIVRKTRPRLMLSDKSFRLALRKEVPGLPDFLEQVLRSLVVREQIEAAASGTSPTMKNISKEDVLDLRVPPFTLPTGPAVAGWLRDLESVIAATQTLNGGLVPELSALFGGVLSRAFAGEL